MKQKLLQVSNQDLAYIAGFLDGDGCILAQIVKGKDYKFKYTVRVSITFYQKKKRHWFLLWLKNIIGKGWIRLKVDGMAEYTITGRQEVKKILVALLPFIKLKKNAAILVLNIIEASSVVQTEASFLEVCRLVDKVAEHTDSKKRTITATIVEKTLILPVETEES